MRLVGAKPKNWRPENGSKVFSLFKAAAVVMAARELKDIGVGSRSKRNGLSLTLLVQQLAVK